MAYYLLLRVAIVF